MSNYKDDLVDICASYPLSEIKNCSEYLNICEQHNEETHFHRFREKIQKIKQYLEGTVETQSSKKGQVSECLTMICRVMEDKNEEILSCCRKFIIKAYSKNWNQEQLDYFERISDILTTADYDYFLSFTRRKRSSGGYNPVNNNYKHFIKAILGEYRVTHEERIEKNLLAKSIHQILRDSGHNGFFYPEYIGDNQPVDPKVERACKNAHIFIQVIQDIMFDKPNVENYCFKEYSYVKDTFLEEQILFVLAEDSHEKFRSRLVGLDYLEWYEHIKGNDIVILKFTTTWKQKDIDLLKKKIETNICNKIKEYKDHLINNVP
jgi:hypothetical protein